VSSTQIEESFTSLIMMQALAVSSNLNYSLTDSLIAMIA